MSIIGIVLGVIAIGLFFWLKNDQKIINANFSEIVEEMHNTHQGMKAIMNDFNNYQVETDRKITQLEKNLEYQNNKFNKRIDKNEKELPLIIQKIVGHIEFAQTKINRK